MEFRNSELGGVPWDTCLSRLTVEVEMKVDIICRLKYLAAIIIILSALGCDDNSRRERRNGYRSVLGGFYG